MLDQMIVIIDYSLDFIYVFKQDESYALRNNYNAIIISTASCSVLKLLQFGDFYKERPFSGFCRRVN